MNDNNENQEELAINSIPEVDQTETVTPIMGEQPTVNNYPSVEATVTVTEQSTSVNDVQSSLEVSPTIDITNSGIFTNAATEQVVQPETNLKKSNKVATIILFIILFALLAYLIYDRFI